MVGGYGEGSGARNDGAKTLKWIFRAKVPIDTIANEARYEN